MATDAAILASGVGYFAPVDHVELADTALPAFRDNRARINSPGRATGASAAGIRSQIRIGAVRPAAVHCAGNSQIGGDPEGLLRAQDSFIRTRGTISGGDAATRRAVDLSAGVVDHVHAGIPEARVVGFSDVPVE